MITHEYGLSPLHKQIIGQEVAITAVLRPIRRTRAGLKSHNRPMGSFIFPGAYRRGEDGPCQGTRGFHVRRQRRAHTHRYERVHGKARGVAPHRGAPGYVGYDEGGDLTEKIRRRPYSVVLFDEIEKAHPDIFNILLQVLEEGQLTDNLGHKVDFGNTIIIMTSNVGARDMVKGASFGFSKEDSARSFADIKNIAMDEVKQVFNPEFLNRVDEVVVFHSLEREHIKKIIDIMLAEISVALTVRSITIELADVAKEHIINSGYEKRYGARSLRITLQREIEDNISSEILRGSIREGDHIVVGATENALTFETKNTSAALLPSASPSE